MRCRRSGLDRGGRGLLSGRGRTIVPWRQRRRARTRLVEQRRLAQRLAGDEPALKGIKVALDERGVAHVPQRREGEEVGVGGVDHETAGDAKGVEQLLGLRPARRRSSPHHDEVTGRDRGRDAGGGQRRPEAGAQSDGVAVLEGAEAERPRAGAASWGGA